MFTDPDALEESMGVLVEDMNPDQLVAYIKAYHEAYGLELAVEGNSERAVFRALQKTYGQKTAGRIVKWALLHYKGKFRNRTIGFFDFTKGAKWWTDQMALEMQQHMNKQKPPSVSRIEPGIRVLDF